MERDNPPSVSFLLVCGQESLWKSLHWLAEEVKKKRSRGQWFREMKSELKKVVWPDRKTVMKNTGTVLLCSLAIGVCVWIFDFVMVTAVQMILSLFA